MPPYIVFWCLLFLSSDIISIEEIGKSQFVERLAIEKTAIYSGLQKGMLTFLRPMNKKIGLEKRTFRILFRFSEVKFFQITSGEERSMWTTSPRRSTS